MTRREQVLLVDGSEGFGDEPAMALEIAIECANLEAGVHGRGAGTELGT
jgi:hypothetical protein